MKSLALSLCFALGLVAPLSAQSLTDGHGPDAWRVVGVAGNDVLNLRAGPGTRYARISRLAPDARGVAMLVCVPTLTYEQFQQLSDAGHSFPPRWCLVELDGARGWANAGYLAEDSGGAREPDGSAPDSGPEANVPAIVDGFLRHWINGDFHRYPGTLGTYVSPDLAESLLEETGADAVFDAQDYDITELQIGWGDVPVYRGLARADATYRNFGRPERLEFSLTRLPSSREFVIIDIRGPFSR